VGVLSQRLRLQPRSVDPFALLLQQSASGSIPGGGVVPNAREQYLQAMASLTELTRTQAERLGGRLARQGELQSAQVNRFAEDLVRRTQKNREAMSRVVQREVRRQLGIVGIATRDEVARLHQRIRALEQAVERLELQSARPRSRSGTRAAPGRGGAAGKEKVSPASAGAKAATRASGATTRATAKRSTTTRASGSSTSSSASSGPTGGGDAGDAS
jgi:polyhydroxyalkanoate synthesis regulator phasin